MGLRMTRTSIISHESTCVCEVGVRLQQVLILHDLIEQDPKYRFLLDLLMPAQYLVQAAGLLEKNKLNLDPSPISDHGDQCIEANELNVLPLSEPVRSNKEAPSSDLGEQDAQAIATAPELIVSEPANSTEKSDFATWDLKGRVVIWHGIEYHFTKLQSRLMDFLCKEAAQGKTLFEHKDVLIKVFGYNELTERSFQKVFRDKNKKRTGYKLTDKVFIALKVRRIREEVLEKLNPIKNKILSHDTLVSELNKVLNPDEMKNLFHIILDLSNTHKHFALGTMITGSRSRIEISCVS
jgi:hypothetical protein